MTRIEAPTLLTPGEVADLFRVDPKTVGRWARTGKIRCFRTVGGHRRFYAEDVRALLIAEGAATPRAERVIATPRAERAAAWDAEDSDEL